MKRGSHRKFGREVQQRKAFMKSLLVALVERGRIRTTEARAKSLRIEADKAVTKAKAGTIAARRLLVSALGVAGTNKMFKEIAPKMADRKGGYTRVLKLGRRTSDSAPMALIEFTA